MAFDDNLLKIEKYNGLYFRDMEKIFSRESGNTLSTKQYSKIKNYHYLRFAMKLRINNRLERRNLTPIKMLGKTVKTAIEEANKEKEEIRELIKSGNFAQEPEMTFDALWNEYTETAVAAGNMTKNYKKNNTYIYNKWLKAPIGKLKFSQITTRKLQTIVNKMLHGGKAPATVDQIRKVFSILFKIAIKKHWITDSPMDEVIFPKYDNKRDFILSEEEARKLYEAMVNYPEIKFRAIFLLMLEGRRKDEILSLDWDRVDLKKGVIYFPYNTHKGNENISFVLSDPLKELFEFLDGPRTGYVFKNPRRTKSNGNKPGGKIGDYRKRWGSLHFKRY